MKRHWICHLSTSPRSIGQVFKLPEAAIRKTLETLSIDRLEILFLMILQHRVTIDSELPDPINFLEPIYMLGSHEQVLIISERSI